MKKALVILLLSSHAMASYCQKVNPTEMDSLMQARNLRVEYNSYKSSGIFFSAMAAGLLVTGIVFHNKAEYYQDQANAIQIPTIPSFEYSNAYTKILIQEAIASSNQLKEMKSDLNTKATRQKSNATACFSFAGLFGVGLIYSFNKASRLRDRIQLNMH